MIGGAIIAAAAIAIGLWFAAKDGIRQARHAEEYDRSGWIYFIGGKNGPIKIGMSKDEPVRRRLPELRAMSSDTVSVIWTFHTPDRYKAEKLWHDSLSQYRHHGEWYERDAVMTQIYRVRYAMGHVA